MFELCVVRTVLVSVFQQCQLMKKKEAAADGTLVSFGQLTFPLFPYSLPSNTFVYLPSNNVD